MVRWMNGLVSGLQNQPRRFDSATHLYKTKQMVSQDYGSGSLFYYGSSKPAILRDGLNTNPRKPSSCLVIW